MLSVRLICVGKLGEKFWADAVKEYTKRLGAYCKLEIIELPEQRLPQTPSEGRDRAGAGKGSRAHREQAAARRVCDCDVCRRQADVL